MIDILVSGIGIFVVNAFVAGTSCLFLNWKPGKHVAY